MHIAFISACSPLPSWIRKIRHSGVRGLLSTMILCSPKERQDKKNFDEKRCIDPMKADLGAVRDHDQDHDHGSFKNTRIPGN